jgi:hypothetical protein
VFGLVVHGDALSVARATEEDFHSQIAEDRIALCSFDNRLGPWLGLVKAQQAVLCSARICFCCFSFSVSEACAANANAKATEKKLTVIPLNVVIFTLAPSRPFH